MWAIFSGLVEAQRKELSKAVEDLKVEVAQRTHEIRRLTEELGDKSKQTGLEIKDVGTWDHVFVRN